MKRYLSILLAVVLLCSAWVLPASAVLYMKEAATPEILEGYVELSKEPYSIFTSTEEVGLDDFARSIYGEVPVFQVQEGTVISLTPQAIAEGWEIWEYFDYDLDMEFGFGNGKYYSLTLTGFSEMVNSLTIHTGEDDEYEFFYYPGKFPFTDVRPTDYFYMPSIWARNVNLYGTSGESLYPNEVVTRGEIVYDLWVMADQPVPTSTTTVFTDVTPSNPFYTAIQWAYATGITGGTSSTTFSPDAPCTRGQVMTFLWRAAGSPSVKTQNTFTDVKQNDYFCKAVSWAVKKTIANGTSETTFSPNSQCTRAHVLTFLFNYS